MSNNGRDGSGLLATPAGAPTPDPRGVRVTVVGAEEGPAPLEIEPAAVPVGPRARAVGQGLLGGMAPVAGLGDLADGALGSDGPDVGLTADGAPLEATFDRIDADRGVLRAEGGVHRVLLLGGERVGAPAHGVMRREVVLDGWRVEVEIEPAARAALRERARRGREEAGRSGPTEVHAIIPGVVVSVSVAPGDQVVAGQQLLVVEAMKMQNELRAPREGAIERVAVGPGTTIEVGDLLLVIS